MESMIGRFISPDVVGPVDPTTGKVIKKLINNPQWEELGLALDTGQGGLGLKLNIHFLQIEETKRRYIVLS